MEHSVFQSEFGPNFLRLLIDLNKKRVPPRSHGNISNVCCYASAIYTNECCQKGEKYVEHRYSFLQMIIIVSHCYDLRDPISDPSDKLLTSVRTFLLRWYHPEFVAIIMNIIDRICFAEGRMISEEKPTDWTYVLGDIGTLVLSIVSDAIAITNIINYLHRLGSHLRVHRREHPRVHSGVISQKLLEEGKKLTRLLPNKFIVTPHGRKLTEPLHEKLVQLVKELQPDYASQRH